MPSSQRIDRIFLLHLWACVPFAPLWLLYGATAPNPSLLPALRGIAAFVVAYLGIRTAIVFRGVDIGRWSLLWPVVDILLVTAILIALHDAQDPTAYLYLLAIAYAALKLPLASALGLVGLAVAGQLAAGIVTQQWTQPASLTVIAGHNTEAVVFRHFFLLLMASLIYFLRRENERVAESVALSEYQRDLAAEMHDGIQHDLVLIGRRLDLAEAVAPTNPTRAVEIAVEQREAARRASDELRFLVRQMRPNATGQDFMEALRGHLCAFADRAGVPVSLDSAGDCTDMPAPYQHPILRILQEAITNAVKHAAPTAIQVRVRRTPWRWRIVVEDNGSGFDAKEVSEGFGLESMRTRAQKLGGECRIISRPGTGTRVSVRLPAWPSERRWSRGAHPRASHGR